MAEELKACPFCGGAKVGMVCPREGGVGWARCYQCNALGPEARAADSAASLWNAAGASLPPLPRRPSPEHNAGELPGGSVLADLLRQVLLEQETRRTHAAALMGRLAGVESAVQATDERVDEFWAAARGLAERVSELERSVGRTLAAQEEPPGWAVRPEGAS